MDLFFYSKVGGLEAEVEHLRWKMLQERAQKEQLARGIQDGQRQIALEKEFAQAVEATLMKKSKDLQEYVVISPRFSALNNNSVCV